MRHWRRVSASALTLSLAVIGCSADGPRTVGEREIRGVAGVWRLVSGSAAGDRVPVIGETTTLGIVDGEFRGTLPCNFYGGRVSVRHGRWRIWDTGTTEVGCSGLRGVSERAYGAAFWAVTSARRDGANRLILRGEGVELRFVHLNSVEMTAWWRTIEGEDR